MTDPTQTGPFTINLVGTLTNGNKCTYSIPVSVSNSFCLTATLAVTPSVTLPSTFTYDISTGASV
jgi:hypothetical protein